MKKPKSAPKPSTHFEQVPLTHVVKKILTLDEPPVTTADGHFHAVQFYKDEDSLAATVARFLAEGTTARQPGIVIATQAHADMIVRELTACGVNVEELRRSGDLYFVDAAETLASFMVGTIPDPMRFRAALGDIIAKACANRALCPIRAYGEMVDLLWQEGNDNGAIKVEMLWNQLATTYDFELLCGYAFGHFYKETRDPRYQEVCDQHSHVLEAAG